MIDGLGRDIDYLRISLTERCNLRCLYCMPEEGVPLVDHGDVLSIEEMFHLAWLMVEHAGITKIRITGGEPLVRKGVVFAVRSLSALSLDELVMTTNGLLLPEFALGLAQAGLHRVNVSLDSLRDERLRTFTRRDISLGMIEEGIRSAVYSGLTPVKVNCVVVRGMNDDELVDFLEWSRNMDVQVRFIEHMPTILHGNEFVSADDILTKLSAAGRIEEVETGDSSTDRLFKMEESGILFGIIAPFSHNMCGRCRRLRLTACGELVTCLSGDHRLDLKELLRGNEDEAKIVMAIRQAIEEKPAAHGGCGRVDMWKLGG
jgi:cyclic pyranopterin phosphate synthase